MIKFINDHKGGVTVFITLILVPAVLFVGVFLDLSILMSSNMFDSTKLEAESALANYNGLLKDVYGLYARTRYYEYRGVITEVNAEPFSANGAQLNNVVPNNNYFVPRGVRLHGTDTQDLYGASLSDTEILQTQISDYMKYRAPAILLSEIANLEGITEAVASAGEDSAVVESSIEVAEEMEGMEKATKRLYNAIADFDSFDIKAEAQVLTDATNEKIDELRTLCEELKQKEAELQAAKSDAAAKPDGDDDTEDSTSGADRPGNIQREIDSINDRISSCVSQIKGYNSSADALVNKAKKLADELDEAAVNVTTTQQKVIKKYIEFEKEYNSCSESMRKGLAETKEDYEKISKADFTAIAGIGMTVTAGIENAFTSNKNVITSSYGSFNPSSSSCQNITTPSLSWQRVRDNAKGRPVCELLDSWYANQSTGTDQSKSTQDQLGNILDDYKEQSQKDVEDTKGAVEIPETVRYELMSNDNIDETSQALKGMDGVKNDVHNMSSRYNKNILDSILDFGNDALNKAFLVEYDLAMFSSSATGKLKDEDGNAIVEETISGIPKSPKMNFLYQSELEYLFIGGNTAFGNKAAAQSTILGILTVRNFAESFTNSEWNNFINSTCSLIPHPAIKIAAMLGIRLLASGIEGGIELSNLVNGKEAELLKSKDGWYLSLSNPGEVDKDKKLSGPTFEYEHIMRMLLLGFVNENKLLKRTGSLIELNMTNYNLGCNERGAAMPVLDFNMNDTSVAVKTYVEYTNTPLVNAFKMFNLDDQRFRYGLYSITAGY